MAATATPAARRASSSSASPSASASSASAQASSTFSWEQALQRDRRVPQMQHFMEQILRTNFPAVAEKLRKEEPPARRYDPAPALVSVPVQQQQQGSRSVAAPVAANGNGRAPPTERDQQTQPARRAPSPVPPPAPVPLQHPAAFQLHGYTSESSEFDSSREVDPMDELSDFETQPAPQTTPQTGRKSSAAGGQLKPLSTDIGHNHQPVNMRASDDGDDEMNGGGDSNDFEMEGDADEDDEDDEDDTACVVCNSTENERQILLCDKCNAEYHLYCLTPPLTQVPLDEWFCPRCVPSQPETAPSAPKHPITSTPVPTPQARAPKQERAQATAAAAPVPQPIPVASVVNILQERANKLQHALASTGAATATSAFSTYSSTQQQNASRGTQQHQQQQQGSQSNGQSNGFSSSVAPPLQLHPGSPPLSVAHTFESDAEKSNQLLIHACKCDELKCTSAVFHEFCPHMKRFLRSACWASHSEKWRGYRIAKVTAELFAYHAMHCQEPQCSVPMCDQLRAEEFV